MDVQRCCLRRQSLPRNHNLRKLRNSGTRFHLFRKPEAMLSKDRARKNALAKHSGRSYNATSRVSKVPLIHRLLVVALEWPIYCHVQWLQLVGCLGRECNDGQSVCHRHFNDVNTKAAVMIVHRKDSRVFERNNPSVL